MEAILFIIGVFVINMVLMAIFSSGNSSNDDSSGLDVGDKVKDYINGVKDRSKAISEERAKKNKLNEDFKRAIIELNEKTKR